VAEQADSLDHAWPLLERLAAGEPATGEALGESLGLTRAAIWKQVDRLRRAGLPVTTIAGSGYTLGQPLELLDAERVQALIDAEVAGDIRSVTVLHTTASTNRWLQEQAGGSGRACLAETQTAGRGRRGRDWYSPLGGGLLLSLSWRFADQPAAIGSLSLVVGLACIAALEASGVSGVRLKWPNDLTYRGAKLGGILVEMRGEAHGAVDLAIGIGLNHRLPADAELPDRAVADLASLTDGSPPGRNQLAADLITELVHALRQFERDGFATFASRYRELDALTGTRLEVAGSGQPVAGIHAGIGEDGALLVETETGIHRVYAGEISVRVAP
jgi:BirA family transcriptional regulator, biotin operon repressor / biotin---[acetyl-CoA-carboxylase] ligase